MEAPRGFTKEEKKGDQCAPREVRFERKQVYLSWSDRRAFSPTRGTPEASSQLSADLAGTLPLKSKVTGRTVSSAVSTSRSVGQCI